MNIPDCITDLTRLRSHCTGAHLIKYRIFNRSNVIFPFPHYRELKLMNPFISVYICPLDEIFL